MKNRLDEIAEEYAEIFEGMDWQWDTSSFKGVPGKDEIKKAIIDKIMELKKKKRCSGDYIASGRIIVVKKLLEDENSTYWEYIISLADKFIDEDELDEMLESSMETKG